MKPNLLIFLSSLIAIAPSSFAKSAKWDLIENTKVPHFELNIDGSEDLKIGARVSYKGLSDNHRKCPKFDSKKKQNPLDLPGAEGLYFGNRRDAVFSTVYWYQGEENISIAKELITNNEKCSYEMVGVDLHILLNEEYSRTYVLKVSFENSPRNENTLTSIRCGSVDFNGWHTNDPICDKKIINAELETPLNIKVTNDLSEKEYYKVFNGEEIN